MTYDVQVNFTKRTKRAPDAVTYTEVEAASEVEAEATAVRWAKRDWRGCKIGVVVATEITTEEIERRTADAFARL